MLLDVLFGDEQHRFRQELGAGGALVLLVLQLLRFALLVEQLLLQDLCVHGQNYIQIEKWWL